MRELESERKRESEREREREERERREREKIFNVLATQILLRLSKLEGTVAETARG
jgi:hypothetical protein